MRSPERGLTATTDGVSRLPSLFSSTVGSPASITATTELVVPRSMPITLAILLSPFHVGQVFRVFLFFRPPSMPFTRIACRYILRFLLVNLTYSDRNNNQVR